MRNKKKILRDIIRCPECRGELLASKNKLRCKRCGGMYDVTDGVAVLLSKKDIHFASEDTSDVDLSKAVWKKRPALREIYHDWYRRIVPYLDKDKICLELSAGSGNFLSFYPHCINSDIRMSKYVDVVMSSTNIPVEDASVNRLVVVDGVHHYNDVYKFFEEAQRVLKKNGLLIMVEPYISPFSYIIRKLFHHEGIDMGSVDINSKAIESNMAIPTILFRKKPEEFRQRFPSFDILKVESFEYLVYPLSGGFREHGIMPDWILPIFRKLEKLLPFKRLFAFKMLVVLRKNW